MHKLWETHEWRSATQEEVISALFNPPPFIDPRDMADINKYHRGVKAKYLNLFYGGIIPSAIKKINKVG